jgi:pantothenate kinase
MSEHDGALDPDVVAQARALYANDQRRLLGVVGGPGAGKSTFAEALAAELGPAAAVLPMDGFHLSNAALQRLGLSERKGAPETFDGAGYLALIRRLGEASPEETVYAPEFHRDIEEPIAGSIGIAPTTGLVILEGNYLLLDDWPWRAIPEALDETWYLAIDDELRRQRLVARHRRFGMTEGAARDWAATVDEPNARLIASGRERASRVLHWCGGDQGRFALSARG